MSPPKYFSVSTEKTLMEQYIIDFLNTVQYWDTIDWTLGHNGPDEPFAYSDSSHQLIYICKYIQTVNTWMKDPLHAVKTYHMFDNTKILHILADYFLQYGAQPYRAKPCATRFDK